MKDEAQQKFLGFQIESSGAVGESLLHLCFLIGTDIHIKLAKRMLKMYPCLINDIYLSEDYFGSLFFTFKF